MKILLKEEIKPYSEDSNKLYTYCHGHIMVPDSELKFSTPDVNVVKELVFKDFANMILQLYIHNKIDEHVWTGIYDLLFDNFAKEKTYTCLGDIKHNFKDNIFQFYNYKDNYGVFTTNYINDYLDKHKDIKKDKVTEKQVQGFVGGGECPFLYVSLFNLEQDDPDGPTVILYECVR